MVRIDRNNRFYQNFSSLTDWGTQKLSMINREKRWRSIDLL
jgi:hypothetical protein